MQKEWSRKSALPESPITLPRKKPKKGKSAVFRQTFLKFSRRPFWKNMGNRPSYFRLDPLELHRYLLEFKTNMNEIDYEGIGKAFCEIRDELLAGSFSDSKNPFAKSLIAEAERFRAIKSANGSKGGRPRKNSPDTRGGSASPAGCAAGKRIPPQEYTTAAGESDEKLALPDIGGSAASAGRSLPPRVGESANSPEVSESSDAANRCFASPAESAAGKRTPRTADGSLTSSWPETWSTTAMSATSRTSTMSSTARPSRASSRSRELT